LTRVTCAFATGRASRADVTVPEIAMVGDAEKPPPPPHPVKNAVLITTNNANTNLFTENLYIFLLYDGQFIVQTGAFL
jgi:hypothetical protein